MISLIITVFSVLLSSTNNDNLLQFNFCGIQRNASYIYLEPKELWFGIMENSTLTQHNLSMNVVCNSDVNYLTTADNSVMTKLPHSTVTALPLQPMENTTFEYVKGNGKCSRQNYYFLFTSLVTFVIGLIIKPEEMYERMRAHFRRQFVAGNGLTSIRNEL